MPSQFSTSAIPCTAFLLPPLHPHFTLWHPLTSPDRLNELSPYHSSLSNSLFPHHLQYFSSSVLPPKPPVTCFPLRPFPFVISCPLCQYPLLPVLDSPFALRPCFFFIPSSTLTYSSFIKDRAMPWGSFVILPHGLWGGRGKKGGKVGKEAGPESLPCVCGGKRIMGRE